MWRNVYSPQPVFAATVLFGNAIGWTTGRLAPAMLAAFEETLPDVTPPGAHIGAPDFVARLAQHIQLRGDVATPFCGVGSRNENKQSADIFFACRDHVIASHSLSSAIQIVYRLAHSDVTAEQLAGMLKSCDDLIG